MRWILAVLGMAGLLGAAEADWVAAAGGRVEQDSAGRILAVDLRGTWVTDGDLAALAHLPELARLDLSLTRITDRGLQELKPTVGITDLSFYYAEQITDEGMAALKGWKRLRRLNLRGTKITDTTLVHLGGMASLESLDIGFAQITDIGPESLAALPNLKELTLGGNKLTDRGLQFLRELPGLRYLDLSGQQRTDSGLWSVSLTDQGLDAIATLKELRELRIGGTQITARSLEKLRGLGKLERLSLHRSKRITDDAVPLLARWASLRWADLKETGVSAKGIATLRQAKPDCRVLWE